MIRGIIKHCILIITAVSAGLSCGNMLHDSLDPYKNILAVVPENNYKIIIGGDFTSYNDGEDHSVGYICRLNYNGTFDESFNIGGTGADNIISAVAVQQEGKILIVGSFMTYNGDTKTPHGICRLNADGFLDTDFNNGDNRGTNNSVFAIAIQNDGKILIGGDFTDYNGSPAPDRICRLNADGSLDGSFGGSGANATVRSINIQSDGKILIGGDFIDYNGSSAPDCICRLTPYGSLDSSFNTGGSGAGSGSKIYTIMTLPLGNILFGGNFTDYNGISSLPKRILMLNSAGIPDTNFNTRGGGGATIVYSIALQ